MERFVSIKQIKSLGCGISSGPKDRGNLPLKLGSHKRAPHTTLAAYAESTDGIHWQPSPQNPLIKKYFDTNQNIVFDKRLNKYVGFSRFGFGRCLARTESVDFIHWSEPLLVLEDDEADGPKTQIYGAGVDIYQGVYIAMLWIYREGIDGKFDTQLATSRDSIRWTRVGNRATWLKLGTTDSWEGGMVRSVERIIQRGKELYIYYCGMDGAHTGPNVKQVVRKHPVKIGLLIQRLDGFASLHSGHQPGLVLTKPFRLSGNQISVNCDADEGELHVEVLDMEGKIRALATTCGVPQTV